MEALDLLKTLESDRVQADLYMSRRATSLNATTPTNVSMIEDQNEVLAVSSSCNTEGQMFSFMIKSDSFDGHSSNRLDGCTGRGDAVDRAHHCVRQSLQSFES
ncbi:unnamed protein product [Lepeophtheirus salmonis]|uniref:(salmon louse) hypothetical protein n=1 Tax=Lepeophtheirus salmonis TaxID=72036 RepID=A0A7R8CI78_LEPSM|nr:unnamed protein product [Lepeophtheirus salmonis]CAF2829725.1 unnamed protein product [Lepeophtheirus salmonis]